MTPRSALTDLAINAVRNWSFSPARRGSQNVAAELELDVELVKDLPR